MTLPVETFEIKRNNFSRIIYAIFTLMTFFAMYISRHTIDNKWWVYIAGLLLFGSGWYMALKNKIIAYAGGFEFISGIKDRSVKWQEITELNYDIVYHGHGAVSRLEIRYGKKIIHLVPRQYQHKPMQRFFEVLNEQCPQAIKNNFFLQQATGKLNWKRRLKMF